ncbi:protein kinase, variant 2 [Balamuthia mandrillaris]
MEQSYQHSTLGSVFDEETDRPSSTYSESWSDVDTFSSAGPSNYGAAVAPSYHLGGGARSASNEEQSSLLHASSSERRRRRKRRKKEEEAVAPSLPSWRALFSECFQQLPAWRQVLRVCCQRETLKVFFIMGIFAFALWLFTGEQDPDHGQALLHILAVSTAEPTVIELSNDLPMDRIHMKVIGQEITVPPFVEPVHLKFSLQGSQTNETWATFEKHSVRLLKKVEVSETIEFDLSDSEQSKAKSWRILVETESTTPVGLTLWIQQLDFMARYQVIFAAIILVLVYVMIILETMHRTIVALLGSFWALAVLSRIHTRPAFLDVITWIDYDTLGLLFGMMLMVGIFSDTGFFEYCAVKAYKLSRGNIWRLVTILCVFTAVISAFLDNVTTILLLTPVTVRLCKVIDLDPIPVIIAEVIFSNIGGTATAVGDPPNILIVNDAKIQASGDINFGNFALHVAPGVIMALIATFFYLKFLLKDRLQPNPIKGRMKEIEIWKKTAERIREHDGEEEKMVKYKLLDYIKELELQLEKEKLKMNQSFTQSNSTDIRRRRKTTPSDSSTSPSSSDSSSGSESEEEERRKYKEKVSDDDIEHGTIEEMIIEEEEANENDANHRYLNIEELEEKYTITDKPLFIKSCIVLIAVIILFFIHSFVPVHLNLAWIAIIGAMIHLLVSGVKDVDHVLEKIELSTLLFFAGLFVLMRALEEMGLMEFIAEMCKEVVEKVPEGNGRLAVAVIIIIWVGAIVGACIDNIPFTQTMIPVVVTLANSDLGLPLQPMVWALSFGCCFGGNGTLIGASANVVAAGLSEQQGYPITFNAFFKVGFPAMILSSFVAMLYVLLFHVAIPWH